VKNYPLAESTISKSELYDLSKWLLKDNQLTKGRLTVKFEKKFSKYLNRKYSIFVNSGSSANLLMASALVESGKLKNNIVIAPAVSWVTTVTPFMQLNFKVKLCDCDCNNLGLDINHFEYLCKKYNPGVAILVNVLGHPNHIDEIKKICKKYKVFLLEDSCESLGTFIKKKVLTGSISSCSSFSFYYGHHISTIEGGMVTTNDFDLYNIMLSIRSHGWARDIDKKLEKKLRKKYKIDSFRNLYTFYYPGYNLRSTDLNAFLGLSQLKKINKIGNVRQKNFRIYSKHLPEFWHQKSSTNLLSSFAFGTLVKNRMEVYKYLKNFNIETRPLICGNIGRHPFWTNKNTLDSKLKNANIIHDYGLYLPNHFNLKEKDIIFICKKFKEIAIPKFFI
jgi:CDP-6-deoxy-D-xylo-4-hexulose-3-dehydrase